MKLSALLCVLGLLIAGGAEAGPAPERLQADQVVTVELRGTKLVRVARDVSRVSVGSSEIVDVQAFPGSSQLLLTAKKVGSSALTIWTGDDWLTVTVAVTHPTTAVLDALRTALPHAKGLKVEGAGSSIILSGEVTNAADAERAREIAKGFLTNPTAGGQPVGEVVSLVRVSGETQVQLEVSFAEVSRSGLRALGFNLWGNKANHVNGGILNPSSPSGAEAPAVNIVNDGYNNFTSIADPSRSARVVAPFAGAFNVLFNLGSATEIPISAAMSVLASNGFSRALAEPTLIALSGHEANFLAGGEFPVVIPAALGQVSVTWKKFGVQLAFTPTVVDEEIQLRLATTVSDIDRSLGVKLQGFEVPGLTTRHGETVVRLKDGQSFAIAGLLTDRVRSSVDKMPGLGDLPILGMLFRSTNYRREESELMVTVTARLVRPQSERAMLPGEFTRSDPSDLELFFLGSYESKEGRPPSASLKAPPPSGASPSPAPSGSGQSRKGEPVGPVGFSRESR